MKPFTPQELSRLLVCCRSVRGHVGPVPAHRWWPAFMLTVLDTSLPFEHVVSLDVDAFNAAQGTLEFNGFSYRLHRLTVEALAQAQGHGEAKLFPGPSNLRNKHRGAYLRWRRILLSAGMHTGKGNLFRRLTVTARRVPAVVSRIDPGIDFKPKPVPSRRRPGLVGPWTVDELSRIVASAGAMPDLVPVAPKDEYRPGIPGRLWWPAMVLAALDTRLTSGKLLGVSRDAWDREAGTLDVEGKRYTLHRLTSEALEALTRAHDKPLLMPWSETGSDGRRAFAGRFRVLVYRAGLLVDSQKLFSRLAQAVRRAPDALDLIDPAIAFAPRPESTFALYAGNGLQQSGMPSIDVEPITVAQLAAAFLDHAETYYRRPDGSGTSEVHGYRAALTYLRLVYADLPAAEFSPVKLKIVRDHMIRKGLSPRTKDGVSRRVANQYAFRIKKVFQWAVENEIVPPSVFHGLQAVSGLKAGRSSAREPDSRHPLPDAAIEAVREDVPSEVRDLVDLQLLTAARSGELCMLTTRDIDRSGAVWNAALSAHKNAWRGKGRLLFFGPRAQLILNRYLRADPDAKIFSYTTAGYRRAVTKACTRSGIKRWTPHWLRHTASTRIRRDYGPEAAQIILGHARLSTTELYAVANNKIAADVLQAIG